MKTIVVYVNAGPHANGIVDTLQGLGFTLGTAVQPVLTLPEPPDCNAVARWLAATADLGWIVWTIESLPEPKPVLKHTEPKLDAVYGVFHRDYNSVQCAYRTLEEAEAFVKEASRGCFPKHYVVHIGLETFEPEA